jgi:antitoxin (DNA-binding transcriptional repressor) of toxin-antitoxin stability system
MAVLRISEEELARDVHTVLDKVERGEEIVVERDAHPVAVIKASAARGRSIDECIALAKAYEERLGFAPVPDEDFAKDVQIAIDSRRGAFQPPNNLWAVASGRNNVRA